MRLLLINPRFPESFWSFRWALERILPPKRTLNPPLGLATLAALCPPDWEVTIVDENVTSVPLEPQADIVGVCGMGVQFPRQRELLQHYRRKGYYTVAGGSYASLVPERYTNLADSVVAGEAEYIWPEFCDDFCRGRPKKLYQETKVVNLEDSPVPRFDLLDLDRYQTVSLQFSRGCPYRCEFCDIIVMFGRKPRTKSLDQVGRELDALRRLGVRRAFFVDDNLIGNKKVAKELLRFLRDYQEQHHYHFHFGTEASLNMAQDDELLRLFREAHFEWVFIGIESPDEESLKETKKFQNTGQDILQSVRHIYSYGLEILAGFIIGFDHDTEATFERQYRFVTASGIQAAMIGLLTAAPRTPLYERLAREGRLRPDANETDNTKLATNVQPLRMTYRAMIQGYKELHRRLLTNRAIATRIRNKMRYLNRPVYGRTEPVARQLVMFYRFLRHGLLPGGPARWFHFLRSLPFGRPWLIPMAIQDWVVGLSMRDYVRRHFEAVAEPHRMRRHLVALQTALARYVQAGVLDVRMVEIRESATELSVSIRGWLDRRGFRRMTHALKRVLDRSGAHITLHIEDVAMPNPRALERLLEKLAKYGDRISIAVHEGLLDRVHIDSSIFHLVLVS